MQKQGENKLAFMMNWSFSRSLSDGTAIAISRFVWELHPPTRVIPSSEDPATVTFQLHIRTKFNHISNMLTRHNIYLVGLQIRKNFRFLPLVKDYLGLKTPATPESVNSSALGRPVVQLRPGSRKTISIPISIIQMCQPWQSMASPWDTASNSRTQVYFLQHSYTLNDLIKEVKEIILHSTPHSNNMNREDGLCLPRKHLTFSLNEHKKPHS
jgi:hypothetical protein